MKIYSNTLCNRPLQWGDREQIKELHERELMLKGEKSICEVDWLFGTWGNKPTPYGAPSVYPSSPKNSDCVYLFVKCPNCNRLHKHIVGYDYYELQVEQWHEIDSQPIECWNCGLEMYIDQEDNNIYVKQ